MRASLAFSSAEALSWSLRAAYCITETGSDATLEKTVVIQHLTLRHAILFTAWGISAGRGGSAFQRLYALFYGKKPY